MENENESGRVVIVLEGDEVVVVGVVLAATVDEPGSGLKESDNDGVNWLESWLKERLRDKPMVPGSVCSVMEDGRQGSARRHESETCAGETHQRGLSIDNGGGWSAATAVVLAGARGAIRLRSSAEDGRAGEKMGALDNLGRRQL